MRRTVHSHKSTHPTPPPPPQSLLPCSVRFSSAQTAARCNGSKRGLFFNHQTRVDIRCYNDLKWKILLTSSNVPWVTEVFLAAWWASKASGTQGSSNGIIRPRAYREQTEVPARVGWFKLVSHVIGSHVWKKVWWPLPRWRVGHEFRWGSRTIFITYSSFLFRYTISYNKYRWSRRRRPRGWCVSLSVLHCIL